MTAATVQTTPRFEALHNLCNFRDKAINKFGGEMKIFTSSTIQEFARPLGYAVDLSAAYYRKSLYRAKRLPQDRVATTPEGDFTRMSVFAGQLICWMPPDARQLLWVEHVDIGTPSALPLFEGVGGIISEPHDQRGYLFEAMGNDPWDPHYPNPDEFNRLASLLSVVLMGGWDARMISDATKDWIEFWEGNVLFYSNTPQRLDDAVKLIGWSGMKENSLST